jgi:zinc transport system substrate-binding protein
MRSKGILFVVMAAMSFLCVSGGFSGNPKEGNAKIVRGIVTSDTILSGMIASLLPPHRYSIEAILPPGQCPGHYDVKLSDIEKTQKAALTVSFKGMLFMDKAGLGGRAQILVDAGDRNWMAPDSYIYGLGVIADGLSRHFPEDRAEIMRRKAEAIRKVNAGANSLIEKIKRMGLFGKAIIASSMQKEPLEWMGFRVVGEYGRPEAMSARDVVRLSKIGGSQQAMAVVDNLQSGPDSGKGIAETLGVPHVILTNFPSEKGYLATLGENVEAVAAAVMRK